MKLSDEEESNIKITILEKMVTKKMWGNKHMDYKHLTSGFPSHLTKKVLYVADKLITQGLIIKKPAHYGMQVSLNVNKNEEILRIIEEQ